MLSLKLHASDGPEVNNDAVDDTMLLALEESNKEGKGPVIKYLLGG